MSFPSLVKRDMKEKWKLGKKEREIKVRLRKRERERDRKIQR